jgi:hypothetical protein
MGLGVGMIFHRHPDLGITMKSVAGINRARLDRKISELFHSAGGKNQWKQKYYADKKKPDCKKMLTDLFAVAHICTSLRFILR